jgi:hypothetical protein
MSFLDSWLLRVEVDQKVKSQTLNFANSWLLSIDPQIFYYQQFYLLQSFWVTQLGHMDAFEKKLGQNWGTTNIIIYFVYIK